MNKLKKIKTKFSDFNEGRILVEDFRYYQQQMIDYFLRVIVEYISNKNKNYLKINRIDREEIFTYSGFSNNELERYSVYIENPKKEIKLFFRIYVPKLIYDNFYILNGNFYSPLFYIIDKPITIKENSISLNSLFSSITINIKDNIVIFTGTNLVLNKFIELFLYNDNSDDANNIRLNLDIKNITEEDLIKYFNQIFGLNTDIEGIKTHIELLFFDEYTKNLYSSCYFNEDIKVSNLSDIIKISLIRYFNNDIFNFINLKNKRLCFIEFLLTPLFKKAANIAYQVKKGSPIDELKLDQYTVLKNFLRSNKKKKANNKIDSFDGLSGKTLYDLVNLYSSILIHKCSFVKPGMKSPPPSIKDIHKTHLGKICPITVSSIKPGETVSIIPETYLDIYGQFLDLE